jgi:hypothetical protein
MRRLILGVAAVTLAIPTLSGPAFAQYGSQYGAQDGGDPQASYGDSYDKPGKDRAYDPLDEATPPRQANPDYDSSPDHDPDPDYDRDRRDDGETWQGADGQLYCRRSNGTTGTIIGAGVGALIGRGIDSGRNRGAGTIIGALAGALLGRAAERSNAPVRCE